MAGEDPRKLLVTADLHYGLYRSGDACTVKMAEYVRHSGADVFAIAGDVADAETEYFRACLELFADFDGLKLVVPGNHDLWTAGTGSDRKYREVLPSIARDCGFIMLDAEPAVAERIGFVGNIGWYDYSFRNRELNIPISQYESKELPGVCNWNDGKFIDWEMSDAEFTEKCLRKLKAAYRAIEPRVHTVVAMLHHLPFAELLYGESSVAYEFCRAFMGSERLGALLLDCPKVRYAFAGHRHGLGSCDKAQLEAFCVGSEYTLKRLIKMDLESGDYAVHVFAADPSDLTEKAAP